MLIRRKKIFWFLSFISLVVACQEEIPIVVSEPKLELKVIFPDSLHFGFFKDTLFLFIENTGEVPANWSVRSENLRLTFSESYGILQPEQYIQIFMFIDRSGLKSTTYHTSIVIDLEGQDALEYEVTIDHYNNIRFLDVSEIADAKYDRVNDLMVIGVRNPQQLWKINPITGEKVTLDLVLPPTSVSISLDGNYAAIGHNGWFSYVDLDAMSLLDVFPVSVDVFDIILAPNDWVYLFPRQQVPIVCFQLQTGEESNNTGVSSTIANSRAKLHPSGNFFYRATTSFPGNLEKFSIFNGVAEFMYKSPYIGQYDFFYDLWLSESGSLIFARSRNVFFSTEQQATDMVFAGTLEGAGLVYTLDHSCAAGKVLAVIARPGSSQQGDQKFVQVYDAESLQFIGSIPTPRLMEKDEDGNVYFLDSVGYYGFFNSDGTNFYMILRNNNQWAIGSIDLF